MFAHREPHYQGKSLGTWLDVLAFDRRTTNTKEETLQAQEAIKAMGAASIPFLLRAIEGQQSGFRLEMFVYRHPYVQRWSSIRSFLTWQEKRRMESERRAGSAERAFRVLGPTAKEAVPELLKIIRKPNIFTSFRVQRAIIAIGKDAFPDLLRALDNPGYSNQATIVEMMGELKGVGTNAIPAVPKLVRYVESGQIDLSRNAARTLGRLGVSPELAVPALMRALESKDTLLVRTAAEALGNFGPAAESAVPMLAAALQNSDGFVQEASAQALGKIGRNPSVGVPPLITLLKQKQHTRFAAEALGGFGGSASEAVPELTAALNDPDHMVRAAAEKALARIGSNQPSDIATQTTR